MCGRLIVAVVVALLAGAPLRAAPPEQAGAGRVAALVEQLGSQRFVEREAATRALDEIGAPALPALRKAAQSQDSEVSRRARILIRRIEERLDAQAVLEPKRLRLTYKDTPLAEAVADFAKTSGATVLLLPEQTKAGDRKVTLDTGDVTFWEAFDKLCVAAGLAEVAPPADDPNKERGATVSSMVIIGGGGARTATDVMRPAKEEKPVVFPLGDGKPTGLPTHYAGSLRVRATPPETSVPGQSKGEGEALFVLEVTAESRLRWQKAAGLRIDKAIDDQGRALAPLPVSFKQAPANPGRGSIVVNGVPLEAPPDDGPAARLVPVKLRQPLKPATRLKELSGVIVAQVRAAPQALVTVDDVLKAAGRTVQGVHGGSVRVLEGRQEDGRVMLRLQVEPATRALSDPPVLPIRGRVIINGRELGADDDLLSALNFALLDDKGKPFRTAKAMHTGRRVGAAQEYELTYEPEPGQGRPAKFVYTDRRTVSLEVPFTLKDVPLP
jgi:hypothetical protein